jgi:integrase
VLEEVRMNFIVEFEHYMRKQDKMGHNTAMKYAKDLKQIMKYGVMLEYIPSSPFEMFQCTYKKTKREFLDQEELDTLYQKEFVMTRLEEVRDCYLFSCYTGYAYSDAEALTWDDVAIGIDGEKWIIRNRKKTDTTENVPLLPIPQEIIAKYKNHPFCKAHNKLLPMNSNQRYNAYLKEVTVLCGIKKNLTTHTARHTFATTVLLLNDVPMETAMELLGHTDIRTTQIYGKIVQKKISNDMKKLKDKLSLSRNVKATTK